MPNLALTAWVQEKMGTVLTALARIADIAKDPETPKWYTRNLRSHLGTGFYDGLKVLMWAHDREDDWETSHAVGPTEGGTMALAALLNRLQVPHRIETGIAAYDAEDDEDRLPTTMPGVPHELEDPWASPVRHDAITQVMRVLMHRPAALDDNAVRLLASIGWSLTRSGYEDIALLTPDFIGRDIGISNDDGNKALDLLVELGLVRIVHELRFVEKARLPIQVVVAGVNEPRHEPTAH